MFDTDALHQRGRALEDEFFHRVDEQLRRKLRESLQQEQAREALASATGLQDKELLDHLAAAGFQPLTLSALTLIPIVFVAWADGKVDVSERQIVIGEALHRDLNPSALQLIESWLQQPPPKSTWDLWKEYSAAVNRSLDPEMASRLREEILQQARNVANASGGGYGFQRVSVNEQAVLDDIANTLTSTR